MSTENTRHLNVRQTHLPPPTQRPVYVPRNQRQQQVQRPRPSSSQGLVVATTTNRATTAPPHRSSSHSTSSSIPDQTRPPHHTSSPEDPEVETTDLSTLRAPSTRTQSRPREGVRIHYEDLDDTEPAPLAVFKNDGNPPGGNRHSHPSSMIGVLFESDDPRLSSAATSTAVARGPPPPPPQQSILDFMDDRDHNEWGGPAQIRTEYHQQLPSQPPRGDDPASSSGAIQSFLSTLSSPSAMASWSMSWRARLLRCLGWRGHDPVALPTDPHNGATTTTTTTLYLSAPATEDPTLPLPDGQDHTVEQQVLTAKRIRKLVIQQQRVRIPAPKLDAAGLGFQGISGSDQDWMQQYLATQRHRQEKARRQGAVYRLDHVLGGPHHDDQAEDRPSKKRGRQEDDEDDHADDQPPSSYGARFTTGSKSAAGFALHDDDEDEVYDNFDRPQTGDRGLTRPRVQADDAEYHTEIVEHLPSDPENDNDNDDDPRGFKIARHKGARRREVRSTSMENDLGNVLLSWTKSTSGNSKLLATDPTKPSGHVTSPRLTLDGRPPLEGFVVASLSDGHQQKRFRGPDLPPNYQVQPHQFGPNDHPLILKALSRAVQLEAEDARQQVRAEEVLRSTRPLGSVMPKEVPPAMGQKTNIFAGLASMMNDRFTAQASDSQPKTPNSSAVEDISAGGLLLPEKPATISREAAHGDQSEEKGSIKVTIIRSVQSFLPTSLLCKRFHVPMPTMAATSGPKEVARSREEAFFHDHVLAKAKGDASVKPSAAVYQSQEGADRSTIIPDASLISDGNGYTRPPMEVYKSIFEPSVETDDEDETTQEAPLEDAAIASGTVSGGPIVSQHMQSAPSSSLSHPSTEPSEHDHPSLGGEIFEAEQSSRARRSARSSSDESERGTKIDRDRSSERRKRKDHGREERKHKKKKRKTHSKSSRRQNDYE